jgi:hypothetical protein
MLNTRFFILAITLVLSVCSSGFTQIRSISKIVEKNSIDAKDEEKIKSYALGWSKELRSVDSNTLKEANMKLVSPFRTSVRISSIGRSLYGKYLKEGLKPLLDKSNASEMASVNALQILALLGTEQGCQILLNHADFATEKRPALRLWASVGMGTSFLTGELPFNRIGGYAKLVSNFTKKEPEWFVLTRQFDSLASVQSIPDLDRSKRSQTEKLSFELQTKSLVGLLDSIVSTDSGDRRVRALPFILPSLLLQLVKPGVNEGVKSTTFDDIRGPLMNFIAHAVAIDFDEDNEELKSAYGNAVQSAGVLISSASDSSKKVDFLEYWNNGETSEILKIVETWKASK